MNWNDHDHREDYAPAGHDHDRYDLRGVAEEHHSHHDLERQLSEIERQLRELRGELSGALDRIIALEAGTPEARALELEADQAAADLAADGYGYDGWPPVGADRHGSGCQCPYCLDDSEPAGGAR